MSFLYFVFFVLLFSFLMSFFLYIFFVSAFWGFIDIYIFFPLNLLAFLISSSSWFYCFYFFNVFHLLMLRMGKEDGNKTGEEEQETRKEVEIGRVQVDFLNIYYHLLTFINLAASLSSRL